MKVCQRDVLGPLYGYRTYEFDVERQGLVSTTSLVSSRDRRGGERVQVGFDKRLSGRVGRGGVSNGSTAVTKDSLVETMVERLCERVGARRVRESTDPCIASVSQMQGLRRVHDTNSSCQQLGWR